ncbi:MAG: TIGR02300 family protein [Proteobacteria bacterium]|nr:TIGR02300 family protein [Pseudomonadota bacterium]
MPKEEWGTKRICPTTGKRFFDLNKTPVVSPYTSEVVDIESARRKLATNVAARVSPQKVKAVADPLDADDDLLVVDVDVEDDAELDDDLLEEDGDDTVSLDDLADVASTDDDL